MAGLALSVNQSDEAMGLEQGNTSCLRLMSYLGK